MTRVLVITEREPGFDEGCVIGAADSVENAMKIVEQRFGEYRIIYFQDVPEACIESAFTIEHNIFRSKFKTKSVITLEWFELNKA